ncbi:hypothetical protein AB8899_18215 [Yersinia enterocolitica]|uniref:hypothetical protein n=1 Tax=Yersinia enterocolitica TaxID=630 RepID=UPI0005E87489|nr:hypothetical protein [Yersinia enterocolitica]EKN3889871.1 hypothetical protein [Yersinia enterocolitica]EKN3955528.1 hypothetical protein [Yersinia enterocolitica]EKN3997060.1 hypothetical protein [Yersinia enterocolitica]EKN4892781.1 hypothetical protein [Yersinia enterocolitica]EKN5064961.1 hypothetical protein [Yersinia enterocolitica]
MATYKQIIFDVKSRTGKSPETCWIADVKSQHGLTRDDASNRIDPNKRGKPCPDKWVAEIEFSMRKFGDL